MSKKKDHFEQIDSYLLEEMSDKMKAKFEEAMAEDIELRKEVMLRRDIMQGIRIDGRKKLKATLDEIHDQKDRTIQKSIVSRSKRLAPWLVAAGLVLLLSVRFLWNPQPQPDLFSSYYEPYELSMNLRNLDNKQTLTTIDRLYSERNYTAAQPIIESYLKENPNQKTLQLALAICQFENKEYENAISSLESLENDPFLKDQAYWYLALIHLDQQNTSEAIKNLKPLIDDPTADHHDEARKLFEEIQ